MVFFFYPQVNRIKGYKKVYRKIDFFLNLFKGIKGFNRKVGPFLYPQVNRDFVPSKNFHNPPLTILNKILYLTSHKTPLSSSGLGLGIFIPATAVQNRLGV